MASHTILYACAALLLVACIQADAPNPVEFLTLVAKGVETLGKNTLCVAERGANPDILAKAYKAFDATVDSVKAKVNGLLAEEQFAEVITIVVVDTNADMRPVDSQCADVSKYCPTSDPPEAAKTLAELGKALQIMGATLGCVVAEAKPEALAQVNVIMITAIKKVAKHVGTSTTSVGILLPEIITIAGGFQSLSSSCANAVKSC